MIILGRDQRLAHGAVLLLEPERAVIVRLSEPVWLCVQARDVPAAIELGYLAGNMHWKVRFEGETLSILLEGDGSQYRARLAELLDSGRAAVTAPEGYA